MKKEKDAGPESKYYQYSIKAAHKKAKDEESEPTDKKTGFEAESPRHGNQTSSKNKKAKKGEKTENANEVKQGSMVKEKKSKLPACFGFISTWLAKRKEDGRNDKPSKDEFLHQS